MKKHMFVIEFLKDNQESFLVIWANDELDAKEIGNKMLTDYEIREVHGCDFYPYFELEMC